MHLEMRYESMCSMMVALAAAKDSQKSYFLFQSADWWKAIPAAVIPISGGIYSDAWWKEAAAKRQSLVQGKTLGQLALSQVESGPGQFAATIESERLDCGEVRNRFKMAVTLLADFDGDGIAEALLEGSRINESDTCFLGTGNSLGGTFRVLIKKDGPSAKISLLNVPGIGSAEGS